MAKYDDMAKKCDESLVQATAQLGTHGGELAFQPFSITSGVIFVVEK
jgi:hypothetical protein